MDLTFGFGRKAARRTGARAPLMWFGSLAAGEGPLGYEAQVRAAYLGNAIAQRAVKVVAESVASALPVATPRATPVARLVTNPGPGRTGAELLETLASHLLLHGNAYVAGGREGGAPVALFTLRPERMTVETGGDGWPTAYVYRAGSAATRFAPDELLHLKAFHPLDDHFGLGCLCGAAGHRPRDRQRVEVGLSDPCARQCGECRECKLSQAGYGGRVRLGLGVGDCVAAGDRHSRLHRHRPAVRRALRQSGGEPDDARRRDVRCRKMAGGRDRGRVRARRGHGVRQGDGGRAAEGLPCLSDRCGGGCDAAVRDAPACDLGSGRGVRRGAGRAADRPRPFAEGRLRDRRNYVLGGDRQHELDCELAAQLRAVTQAEPGDVLALAPATGLRHLGIWTGMGLVHAHAGLRRVVEGPIQPSWVRVGAWRLPSRAAGAVFEMLE